MAPLPFEVWIFDGRAPERLCHAPSFAEARARWGHSRHAAIFDEAGELVDSKRGADASRLAAIEAARAGRTATAKPARPLPRSVVTEAMPARPSDPPPSPVEACEAPSPEAPAVEVPAVDAPKPTRPAATRPPLARRRLAPVAVVAPPPTPVVEPDAPAPVAAEEPARVPHPEERSAGDEAKVAKLQRLLSQVTVERDAHRDRVEASEHRAERLRGEVEGLTSDLDLARRDLAATVQQLNELSDRTRAELADVAAERDEAHALLHLALSTGLAAVNDARAETETVLRQSAALSQELGRMRDAAAAPAPSTCALVLDEAVIERITVRAARLAVRASRDDRALRALAERVGGVAQLERMVAGVQDLLRGWPRC